MIWSSSDKIRKNNKKHEQISKKKYFHNTKLIVAIKATREIGHSFPLKDKVSEPKNKSLVVYQINCKNYNGKAERILYIRIEEHKKDSNSALFRHKLETNHQINF